VSLVVEEMQENGKTTTERGETFSTQHHDGRHMGWQSAGHGSWRASCLELTFSSNLLTFWWLWAFFLFSLFFSSFWRTWTFKQQIPEIDTQYLHNIAKIYKTEIKTCISRAKIVVYFTCYHLPSPKPLNHLHLFSLESPNLIVHLFLRLNIFSKNLCGLLSHRLL